MDNPLADDGLGLGRRGLDWNLHRLASLFDITSPKLYRHADLTNIVLADRILRC